MSGRGHQVSPSRGSGGSRGGGRGGRGGRGGQRGRGTLSAASSSRTSPQNPKPSLTADDFPDLSASLTAPTKHASAPSSNPAYTPFASPTYKNPEKGKTRHHNSRKDTPKEEDSTAYPFDMGNGVVIHDGQSSPYKHLVVHCQKSKYDVYIGRPGKWGNPFKVNDMGRNACIAEYYRWITSTPQGQKLLAEARVELKGKVLACHCAPLACHGHVLAQLANDPAPSLSLSSSPPQTSDPTVNEKDGDNALEHKEKEDKPFVIYDGHTSPYKDLVVHCQRSKYDVYIGRPSKWGNPFKASEYDSKTARITMYYQWLTGTPEARQPDPLILIPLFLPPALLS